MRKGSTNKNNSESHEDKGEVSLLEFLQKDKTSFGIFSKSPNTPRFLDENYKKTPSTPRYEPSENRTRSTSFSPYSEKSSEESQRSFNKDDDRSPDPKKKSVVESLLGMFKINERDEDDVTSVNVTNISLKDIEFKQVIGKGHYGKVFLASHNQGPVFAVKKINKRRILPVVTKLKEEILLFKKLNSLFLIKLHRVLEDNDSIYLVLDYSDGGELRRLLSKKEKFDENVIIIQLIFRKLDFTLLKFI